MTPDVLLSLLFVFLVLVVCVLLWRFSNSTGSVTWSLRTSHPEPSDAEIAKLTAERDEARKAAEALRAELEGRG